MVLSLAALTFTLAQATPSVDASYQDAPVPVVASQPGWTRYVPVASSLVIPGTGQMIQGDWFKGAAHLGFSLACLAATQFAPSTDPTLKIVGGVGMVGIGLWSPWDAFTHATPAPAEPTP